MQSDLEQFSETTSTEAFALQNHKLLRVRLDRVTIQAKLGSMVAYQGEVTFDHAGAGGLGRLVKKVATGEGQSLMKVSGRGEVFLADAAQDIHLLYLQDDRITVNGRNVLAFDDGIDWDIERVKSVAGMVGGGLFNTRLQGTGWVAVLSDGPPVRLDVAQAPTFADAQAAVAWSAGVTTSLKTDVKLKSLIGLGSGETFQIAFGGEGWVLVQPSEGRIDVTARSGSSLSG
ncbi:MAG TPA: AIM24 family protein [Solirubrobacteraceae bacterium]|nr:AIM24 family protein [Solirubrobacteraceae bacterium]